MGQVFASKIPCIPLIFLDISCGLRYIAAERTQFDMRWTWQPPVSCGPQVRPESACIPDIFLVVLPPLPKGYSPEVTTLPQHS